MPVAKAPAAAAAAMDDCPHHKDAGDAAIKTEAPCPSDGDMSGCGAALCALKCFKVLAVFAAPTRQRLVVPASGEASLPEALVSISWRPSPPPPRS